MEAAHLFIERNSIRFLGLFMLFLVDLFLRIRLPWFKPTGYVDDFGFREVKKARYLGKHIWFVMCVDGVGRVGIHQTKIEDYSRAIGDWLMLILFFLIVFLTSFGIAIILS